MAYQIHCHIYHILKAKIKRPVFRKLSDMNQWISLHTCDRIFKEKEFMELLRKKKGKSLKKDYEGARFGKVVGCRSIDFWNVNSFTDILQGLCEKL